LGEMLKQVQHDSSGLIGVADSEDSGPHDSFWLIGVNGLQFEDNTNIITW